MLTEERFKANAKRAEELFAWARRCRRTFFNVYVMKYVVEYLTGRATGYYSSDAVESFYTDYGKTQTVRLSKDYESGTCLIVSHEIGSAGGHARVVERWIEYDKSRRYSLAVTRQTCPIAPRAVKAVSDSGGSIYQLRGNIVKKSLKLREIASRFESVLLVVDPEEVSWLIAFGTDDFKRPVFCWNIADHLFWMGLSVSDRIADMRSWGREISQRYRGYNPHVLIPVPMEECDSNLISKNEARSRLGLDKSAKIIVSAAREVKFARNGSKDYPSQVLPILEAFPDAQVIIIGPSRDYFPEWRSIVDKYGKRFNPIGYVPHDILKQFYRAADLVIDSYPSGSLTSLEDAVFCGAPVLSRSGSFDWIKGSSGFVSSTEEILVKAKVLLTDEDAAAENNLEIRAKLSQESGSVSFNRGVSILMGSAGELHHRVGMYKSAHTYLIPNDQHIEVAMGYQRKRVLCAIMQQGPVCLMACVAFLVEILIDLKRFFLAFVIKIRILVDKK